MRKPYLERVVASDGQSPLLLWVIACLACALAAYFLHFLVALAPHLPLLR